LAAFLALSRLGPLLGANWLRPAVLGTVLGFTFLSGLFMAFAGRSRIVNLQYRRIDAAVETLARRGAAREATLEAAVQLLDLAHVSSGPTTIEAFAPEAMRKRLGAAGDLVVEVERALLEEGRIYPVFTLDRASGEKI
jgi:hypothetical protein